MVVQTVHEKSKGLYKLAYDDLILDEIGGSLSIKNLSLRFDSTRLFGMALAGQAPAFLINIHIPEINVRGVITPQALIKNELIGRILEIKEPIIEIIHTGMGKDSTRNSPTQEVYKQILGSLKLISIDSVVAFGANISTSWLRSEKTIVHLNNISVSMIDVKVDSVSNSDTSRYLFAKQIKMECANMAWASANKLYDFNISGFSLNSVSGTAGIREFKIRSVLGEEAYAKKFVTQKDRVDLVTQNIQFTRLNFIKLFNDKIEADSVIISGPQIRFYRDLTLKRDSKNRMDRYVQGALEAIPISVLFRKIILNNGYLEYKLIGEKTHRPGKLQFFNLYTRIENFTNDTKEYKKNNIMTMDISSSFLNQSTAKLSWRFYLGSSNGRYDLSGKLGPIDATKLNPLSMPLAALEITKGELNGLNFDLRGNILEVNGQVRLIYNDLRVNVLKINEETKEIKNSGLLKLAANIMIRNSSAKKNEVAKVEKVVAIRDPNRSFIHMNWKALSAGLRQTLGIK